MSSEIEDFVLGAFFCIPIQSFDIMLESLPWSFALNIFQCFIRRVGARYETEVFFRLMSANDQSSLRRYKGRELEGVRKTYVIKSISISIRKPLLENLRQDTELISRVWWRKSDCCHVC